MNDKKGPSIKLGCLNKAIVSVSRGCHLMRGSSCSHIINICTISIPGHHVFEASFPRLHIFAILADGSKKSSYLTTCQIQSKKLWTKDVCLWHNWCRERLNKDMILVNFRTSETWWYSLKSKEQQLQPSAGVL